ncbi:MAG: hypothetical protein ACLQLG_11645 [Thermoguttaceae bacterium]
MGLSWIGAIIIALAGGIAGGYKVLQMSREARQRPCPNCGQMLGSGKPGKRTWEQVLWGGGTCPGCGCDVDRHGNERK